MKLHLLDLGLLEHRLDNALQAAGYGLDDIRAVVMSHLRLDHAGGLELFRGRDVLAELRQEGPLRLRARR